MSQNKAEEQSNIKPLSTHQGKIHNVWYPNRNYQVIKEGRK